MPRDKRVVVETGTTRSSFGYFDSYIQSVGP